MNETYTALPERPHPQRFAEDLPYWDGLREHRLLVQRCTGCGKLRHYPRPVCDSCYVMTYDWQELGGRGSIHSWAINHHPFHAAFKREVPYIMLTVDLDEGVRLHGVLLDGDAAGLKLGAAVVVDYIDVDDTLTVPAFRLAA